VGIAALNALADADAAAALARCCGAERWVQGMLASRPFADSAALLAAAERLWFALGPDDWLEAFAHHPRIGAAMASGTAHAWSRQEQRDMDRADDAVRCALAEGNREYEARFGWIYLVRASGRTAAEMLELLQTRLRNDPDGELRVAAKEHAEITRLRLEKLLEDLA
jgi:2-oxo-4-hydroxy-4-carboxy-5-ureidoimidazoline decarboxylase